MTKAIKSMTIYRSDIGVFEKETLNPYYIFHLKEYSGTGQLLSETEFRPNGEEELKTTYEYDAKGHLASRTTYYSQEDTLEKMVYEYDGLGLKTNEKSYFGEDLFEIASFVMDDKENVVLQTRTDDEENEIERIESVFDADARRSKQVFYENGGKVQEISFFYDSYGNCIKEIHAKTEGGTETIENEYNAEGKKTVSITTDAKGYMIGRLEIEYDEKMNPIRYANETSGYYNSETLNTVDYDEEGRVVETQFYDVMNSYLMSKEKISYDDEGRVAEEERFEINPQQGMKKVHFRLRTEYEYFPQ